jgi:hypothetical protein
MLAAGCHYTKNNHIAEIDYLPWPREQSDKTKINLRGVIYFERPSFEVAIFPPVESVGAISDVTPFLCP